MFSNPLQRRKINLDNTPDQVEIKLEVSMRDAIAEVGDVAPGDLRMAISEVSGEFPCCLGQRFDSVQGGVLDQVVGQEGITAGRRPLLDKFDAPQDVVEVSTLPLLAERGTAS